MNFEYISHFFYKLGLEILPSDETQIEYIMC